VNGPTPSDARRDPSATSRPRIIVVDDDRDITILVAGWLSDMADVHTATTARRPTLANVIQPDLAIIDVMRRGRMDSILSRRCGNPHLVAVR
jgi:CheY-like chemotaxis protein